MTAVPVRSGAPDDGGRTVRYHDALMRFVASSLLACLVAATGVACRQHSPHASAGGDEPTDASPSPNPGSVRAYDDRWIACQDDSDCVLAIGPCGRRTSINRKGVADYRRWSSEQDANRLCAHPDNLLEKDHRASCTEQRCEVREFGQAWDLAPARFGPPCRDSTDCESNRCVVLRTLGESSVSHFPRGSCVPGLKLEASCHTGRKPLVGCFWLLEKGECQAVCFD
jgi:hypothetical protein